MSFTGSASARARFSRRSLVKLGLSAAALGLTLERTLRARAATRVVRIGFQKYGALILLKGRGLLERQLKPLGYDVQWVEYPAGPQLLDGLNDGAIDFGATGEAPPIFAQAAGTPLVYVAHEPPAPQGEAILVQKNSAIRSLAELKGKKIALNRGSNVHYLLVKALEKAAIAYSDVETVFLPPDDARRAFDHGSVDAWAIWDPHRPRPKRRPAQGRSSMARGLSPTTSSTSLRGASLMAIRKPSMPRSQRSASWTPGRTATPRRPQPSSPNRSAFQPTC